MELKDVILSTLAEMEEENIIQEPPKKNVKKKQEIVRKKQPTVVQIKAHDKVIKKKVSDISEEKEDSLNSELLYLNSIRERLLVLFEGFQAPNNNNLEAKIDMTLNFLEYILATLDTRIETLKKGKR